MSIISRENVATLQDKVIVKLNKEDFIPTFEKSLRNYAKTASIQGFRKGMVPSGLIRKMYGQSILNEEIIRTASRELETYLKNEKVSIFAQPMMSHDSAPLQMELNDIKDVEFKFDIGLQPTFTIPAIDNKAALSKYKIEVSDKMLDEEIEASRKHFGEKETKETIDNKEDIVSLTFNHVQQEQPNEETAALTRYPELFQNLLMGKKANDTFSFEPEKVCKSEELEAFLKNVLKNSDLANETVQVEIKNIQKVIPAELNEEFYGKVFPKLEIKEEAIYRDTLRTELSREFERYAVERLNNEIYELLVHTTKFDLPTPFLKRWLKEGQEKPKTEEQVENEFHDFEHNLRWSLIAEKLMIDNKISVSKDDVQADMKARVMSYFGIDNTEDAPWMDGYLSKVLNDSKSLEETHQRLLFERLYNALYTQLAITEKDITAEEFFKLESAHAAHHHH